MRTWKALFALILALSFGTVVTTPQAEAIHPHIRRVLVLGGYGAALGTVVGLVSVPLSQDFRTMFIGTSVGMYLGLVFGIVYVATFDSPDNPLRAIPTGDEAAAERLPRLDVSPVLTGAPPALWVQVPVARF